MTISRRITALPVPTGDQRIARGTLAYMRARYQTNVHSLVLEELERSGLTNAQLARRLGMDPAQLNRLLGNPSNMTLDTLADLLFAIAGKEPDTKALPYGEMDKLRDERAAYIQSARHLTIEAVVLGMRDAASGSATDLWPIPYPTVSSDILGAGPIHRRHLLTNSSEYKEAVNG